MTRSTMRTAALAVASGALLAGLLSGCGAGQVTQTESQHPPISGVNADSPDHTVGLRDLAVEYGGPRGYAKGGNAALRVRIVNTGTSGVRLTGVASSVGNVVTSGPGASASPSAPASAPASGGPASSAPASASASASPTPAPLGDPRIDVTVPMNGIAVLAPGNPRYLRLVGLSQELKPGDTIEVKFDFDNGVSIRATVPIGLPLSPLPRSPMPLEGGGE